MGKVLRVGVLVSAAMLVSGYFLALVRDRTAFNSHVAEQAHLAGHAGFPHSFAAVWDGIARGSGQALIVAGVLAVILTPVAGLVTSAVAFARRRDWLFTSISALVLTIILGSFVYGWLSH